MTAGRTDPPRRERACIRCLRAATPLFFLAVPAFPLLAAQLFPSAFFNAAWPGVVFALLLLGADACVLLSLASLGICLRSRADRGRWGPGVLWDIFCGLYPAAVTLLICSGSPRRLFRYLIMAPFRILVLMLTG